MVQDNYQFFYKGVLYDATLYAKNHPGGQQFFKDMKQQKEDITQYFRALHSEKAQQILLSLPKKGLKELTPSSKQYMRIQERIRFLYKPNWLYEILLAIFYFSLMLFSIYTEDWFLAGLASGLVQTTCGWIAHSAAHSRDFTLCRFGTIFVGLTCGYSLSWWSPKHNRHHMFSNSMRFDDDIKHDYKLYLYPFLHLKWRYDSIQATIKHKNYFQLAVIMLHYFIILQRNPLPLILGQLVSGFYSSNVLIGNHQRQVRFVDKIGLDYVDHQLKSCRNYDHKGVFWMLMMGGMQYQTQHHLYPQVPFYNLPQLAQILSEELQKAGKKVIYGPVI